MDPAVALIIRHGYNIEGVLSNQQYSSSYIVTQKDDRKQYIIKAILLGHVDQEVVTAFLEPNSTLLKRTLHPNIREIQDFFIDQNYYFLVMEYIQKGSLRRYLDHCVKVRPEDLHSYTSHLLQGVNYIHQNQIAHHNIKPSNLFIDNFNRLKISDIDLVYYSINGPCNNFHGSIQYMAPEVINQVPHDPFKADVWSIGVCIYEMATGMIPWRSTSLADLKNELSLGYYNFPTDIPYVIQSLIQMCLIPSPNERCSLRDLLLVLQGLQQPPIPRMPRAPEIPRSTQQLSPRSTPIKSGVGSNKVSSTGSLPPLKPRLSDL